IADGGRFRSRFPSPAGLMRAAAAARGRVRAPRRSAALGEAATIAALPSAEPVDVPDVGQVALVRRAVAWLAAVGRGGARVVASTLVAGCQAASVEPDESAPLVGLPLRTVFGRMFVAPRVRSAAQAPAVPAPAGNADARSNTAPLLGSGLSGPSLVRQILASA